MGLSGARLGLSGVKVAGLRGLSRRSVLAVGPAVVAFPSLQGLWARESPVPDALVPVADADTGSPLLRLREGFAYRSFSWAGDTMAGGWATPARHDGMAAFPALGGGVTLVRNHEEVIGPGIGGSGTPVYDDFEIPPGTDDAPDGFPGFGGGVTAVSYARDVAIVEAEVVTFLEAQGAQWIEQATAGLAKASRLMSRERALAHLREREGLSNGLEVRAEPAEYPVSSAA